MYSNCFGNYWHSYIIFLEISVKTTFTMYMHKRKHSRKTGPLLTWHWYETLYCLCPSRRQAIIWTSDCFWGKVFNYLHRFKIEQYRRWNADKPSAALDPYIPTWLTTSSANHRPANFWKSFFFFETLEGNCEKLCNLMLNWCGSISNLKLPFSDSWSTNNHRYYLSVYYGNVYIFSQYVTQM